MVLPLDDSLRDLEASPAHLFTIIHHIMPTLYRVTFKDLTGREEALPVYSTSAVQAVADLTTLGYKLRKVTAVFPTV